ncbi:hypothetical protein AXF42_Ash012895 [Apostasia shenzhenica]|uniref:Uncharacterized protein n=1 Tax=Apostasia shenzhenica TaxID=1088818 RepID=A0A2I0ARK8_9ASPA|nr:hypothetical protein AXF42_Ash012895 [Apostasia shenzhenica]
MAANPGYYVAIINPIPNSNIPATTNTAGASARAPAKHLKLLLPDDTLHLGHLYRLVSFQEVLGDFKTKKRQRLSRTITACRERRRIAANRMIDAAESSSPAIIPGTGRGGGGRKADAQEAAAMDAISAEHRRGRRQLSSPPL